MGYGTRNNGQIKTFWPDDTDNQFFLAGDASLGDILELAAKKWPGFYPDSIQISPEYIHTDCIGYDCYDSADYTRFLCISRKVSA